MTQPNKPTRRTVLRSGAALAAIGATIPVAGSAAAKEFQGGSGFLELGDGIKLDGNDEFTVSSIAEEDHFLYPSCNGKGKKKKFDCYTVYFCGEDCEGWLCINPNRRFETADSFKADATHRITQAKKCPKQNDGFGGPVYHVAFQPIR